MNLHEIIEGLTEELAAIEHDRWSRWQRYVHEQGVVQSNGSLLLPADLVEKWERQMTTPYEKLSEKEKQSDRDQVARYLPMITRALK
ncbi:hypothetical protein [Pinirhizobacter sp.]|jgi:hypothetical protein|uniref:hypothetical protein n=1 Tax=Pinirhizobacter sp. TaxID=2950432 RepID=UPI002F3F8BA8